MKSVFTRSAAGRRAAAGTVLALTAATLSLGLAGPASAINDVELQGTVTGVNGAALADVYVEVDDATTGADLGETSTDAAGHYSFNGLSTGDVKVFFSAPDPTLTLTSALPYQNRWSGGSRFSEGASITHVTTDPAAPASVNINLPQYAAINGNVVVGGGHVATDFTGFNVYDADGNNSFDNSSRIDPWYDTFFDDATGNYRLVVDPGSIRVGAYAYDNVVSGPDIEYLNLFWKDSDTLYGATPIAVASGQTVAGVNFRLTDALTARQAPQIVGIPSVGRALTATPGSWSRNAGTEFSYSWRRGTLVVGTGSTYVPTVADFGQRLSVTVMALNGPHAGQAATSTSDPVRYPADAKGKAKALAGHKVRVATKIVSAKQSPVKGKVVLMRGTKVVHKAVKLVKGKAVIVAKHQPKGKQTYTLVYKGNALLSKAVKTFTVRVH